MAHLLVSREMVIDSENAGHIGKHKRAGQTSDQTVTFFPPLSSNAPSASKRRALAPLTNREPPARRASGKGGLKQPLAEETQQNKVLVPTTLDDFFFPHHQQPSILSSQLTCLPITTLASSQAHHPPLITHHPLPVTHHPPPIGREVNLSSSRLSGASFGSLRLGSPFSFGSPMLLSSSPDVFNSSANLRSKDVIDIDQLEDCNCAVSGEYAREIFSYLREAEVRFQPLPYYFTKQPDVTNVMRCILVDWLVEVTEEFRLDPHTLFMGVSIVDRFLSCMSICRAKLQLVGASSMYIAAKFEEIYPPELSDFVYITDDTYTKLQIVRMERVILAELAFQLVAPTAHTFLLRFLKAAEAGDPPLPLVSGGCRETTMALTRYLSELTLLDADPYLKYCPSVIAASAVCLARHTLGLAAWPPTLQHYSGYTLPDIGSCVQDLHRSFAMSPQHSQQAIRNKYSTEKFMKVSSLRAPETLPC